MLAAMSVGLLLVNSIAAISSYNINRPPLSSMIYKIIASLAAGIFFKSYLLGIVGALVPIVLYAIVKLFPNMRPPLVNVIRVAFVVASMMLTFRLGNIPSDLFLKHFTIQSMIELPLKILHPLSRAV